MNTPIEICHNFLLEQYQTRLEMNGIFADSVGAANVPAWKNINPGNKMLSPDANVGGGLLLDAEIGVMLYLLPFTKGQDLTAQFIQALGIRSRLLPEANYRGTSDVSVETDPHGAWRIVLHWLAEKEEDMLDWQEKIATIRRETAHMEEIPVDLICLGNSSNWLEAYKSHGFPRLLIETRAALKHNELAEVTSWLSADTLVKKALNNFPQLFPNGRTRELAEEVLKQLEDISAQPTQPESQTAQLSGNNGSPKLLNSIALRNFRNIDELSLLFESPKANAYVLHGPNGTGKSNVFEALSLAMFNSSYRYSKFMADDDIATRKRTEEYRTGYLHMIGTDATLQTSIALNKNVVDLTSLASNSDDIRSAEIKSNGTMLSQEKSLLFSILSGYELGHMVLAGYSELAKEIEGYVENSTRRANEDRQNLLRNLGLNASITKIQTARERISKSLLDGNEMPRLPGGVVKWLEIAASMEHPEYNFASLLAPEWRGWGSEAIKQQLAEDLAALSQNNALESRLKNWFERYNLLIDKTAKAIGRLDGDNLACLKQQADELIEPLKLWGAWLAQSGKDVPVSNVTEIGVLQKRIAELQKKQQEIVTAGNIHRNRLLHFSQVDQYLNDGWSKKHPNECPTCGTDLTERQGIVEVVKLLRNGVEDERKHLLEKYQAITTSIKEIQAQLVVLGQQQCPVSPEIQAKLVQYLQWLVPDDLLSDYIKDETQREKLVKEINILRDLPQLPEKLDVANLAFHFADNLARQFANAALIFAEPDAWKPIQEALTKKMSEIVAQHLPETLGKLWNEILLNLTSAPWLLPERLTFHVKAKRGEQSLQIRMGKKDKAPLARYILNTAEIHTMGLAWFFVRYLTYGRFQHAAIVMDDPAQEMDQATYRELCRVWETLIRLHKIAEKPLCLLLMLHQEERALDAARATGGELYLLGWGKGQKQETVRRITLLGEGFAPLTPERVLEKV